MGFLEDSTSQQADHNGGDNHFRNHIRTIVQQGIEPNRGAFGSINAPNQNAACNMTEITYRCNSQSTDDSAFDRS